MRNYFRKKWSGIRQCLFLVMMPMIVKIFVPAFGGKPETSNLWANCRERRTGWVLRSGLYVGN
jgi:hypothetical protein